MSWLSMLNALPGVTLEAMNERAALQTRVDRKYVVDRDTWASVMAQVAPRLQALEIEGSRQAHYRSVYYDTPDLASYLAAARKRPRRFKVRTREYVDSGLTAVEVKLRSARGDTVKHRSWLDAENGLDLLDTVESFAATFPEVGDAALDLQPTLVTTYERATLLHPEARITVDSHVAATDAAGERLEYGDALIVETKTAHGACEIDRALWSRGIRQLRLSKYATSMAALHPELPANRWYRTLSRHVAA